jgi:hypothetical protein
MFLDQPRTTSWATLSRPCGTQFPNEVFIQGLQPVHIRNKNDGFTPTYLKKRRAKPLAADLLCKPRTSSSQRASVRGSGFSNPRKRSDINFGTLALVAASRAIPTYSRRLLSP